MHNLGSALPTVRPPRRGSRWYVRVPFKCLLFAIITTVTLYPYPRLTLRHVRNMDAMIDPAAPQLEPLAKEIEARLRELPEGQGSRPHTVQREVQRYVYETVQYEWDWKLWGLADYLPTVQEIFDKAAEFPDGKPREDCDGQAVIAASLLRRLGQQANLVTDLRHVWVRTPQGQWMNPGGPITVASTAGGNLTDWTTFLGNGFRALAYGVAVFPWWRELIIVVAAVTLSWNRRAGRRAILPALLIVQGWLFMRCSVLYPDVGGWIGQNWPAAVGLLHVAVGLAMSMLISARARHRRTS